METLLRSPRDRQSRGVRAKTARGGRSPKSGDVLEDYWYSWTDSKALLKATTLAEFMGQFFEELDYYTESRTFTFSDNNKIGQEDALMEHLAPFLQDTPEGSYAAEWTGEDGAHWAWRIEGGKAEGRQRHRQLRLRLTAP